MVDEIPVAEAPEMEVDTEAVERLPVEELGKLKRGEIEPPKRSKPKDEPPPASDGKPAEQKQDFVPHEQFHRTNERRKEAEAERDRERARADQMAQRMAELLEAARPKPEPATEPEIDLGPDPETNPMGWIAWRREKDREELAARQQWQQQQQQQTQAERQWQQAYGEVFGQFQSAAKEKPELLSLYEGLRGSYADEYAAYGYTVPQIAQLVEKQEAQIIQWAYHNRVPIADAVLNLAKARGIAARAPADGNGRELPDRDAMGRFKAAQAEMERQEATRKAALSLNGGGSDADVTALTPQMIADMSPEDFAKFKTKWGSISNYLDKR